MWQIRERSAVVKYGPERLLLNLVVPYTRRCTHKRSVLLTVELLPLQVEAVADSTCEATEGPELRPACVSSCKTACEAGLGRYAESSREFSGYALDEKARGRVLRGCERQCVAECGKPGQSYGFTVPYRH